MILDDIMKYRAQQLEREKAACGLDAMKVRAEKALACLLYTSDAADD